MCGLRVLVEHLRYLSDQSVVENNALGYMETVSHHVILFPAPELPIVERRNWLIHQHYVRKDYDTCKVKSPLLSFTLSWTWL